MASSRSWLLAVSLTMASLGSVSSSSCSRQTNCLDCDSLLDSDGSQICSWCVSSQSCVPQRGLECVFGDKISKTDDCPRLEKPGVYYNDTFARNEMFAISAAAYFNNPQACMDNFIAGAVVRKQFTVPCDDGSELCTAFTAVSARRRALILGFRGTDSKIQLFLEGWETVLGDKVPIIGGGQVSRYFLHAFEALWRSGLEDDFKDMVSWYGGYELWISGHSLGGALASVAAQVIAYGGHYDAKYIKLVTFGQPRTGDHDFATAHDNAIAYSYRVTHSKDWVAHLPSRDFRNYHHHRYEVWYNNDMSEGANYKECYTPDDDSCSDSELITTSIDDHLSYFGKAITWIGDTGCIEKH